MFGNNLVQARNYLGRALELDPELGLAHYNLGLVLVEQGELEEAEASFHKAIEFSPHAPEPSYHLGLVYLKLGKIEEGKKAFEEAIALNPKYPEANYQLGQIFLYQGSDGAALDKFRRAAEVNPNYADAYYAAGFILVKYNRYRDAQPILEYAQHLYDSQGQKEWAAKTQQFLQSIQEREETETNIRVHLRSSVVPRNH